jgi:hypothetical protein
MKLAASLDVNGNKIKDGNKVYSMPSVAGTLAVLSDIPKGSFVIKGTATAISQDKTILTVDGEPVIASQSNLGYVYQIGEEEFVSNGEEWIVLGAEVDLSEYQQKTDQLLTTVDKTVVGAINELKEEIAQGGGGSADLTNYYTKEQTDANIEVVASVTARAVNEIKNSIGASDELKVSFDGTKHLSSAKSIMDALFVLDEGIESEDLNNRISAIERNIATMQKTLTRLSTMFNETISISAEGSDGSYTIKLAGSYGGGGNSSIEGTALIAAGEIENNALVLTSATIEGSALYL